MEQLLTEVAGLRRRIAELETAQSESQQVEEMLLRRNRELEEQYQQSQKMEVLGQMTAGIAHDFNNVLTAVNGYAELLHVRLPPGDPAHDMVGKMLRAGRRGADLAHQLLVFSRRQTNKPQVVNLNYVVAEMEQMLRRIIGEHIHLTTALVPELWSVKADPAQIEQVIVNLVVNARDAMPAGGRLSIETANVVLDKNWVGGQLQARPGDHVLLAISDTGIGMTPEVKAHLFEPFFTTKGRGQGTGLGLATVYSIVRQSGGSIWVYSEEGMGTTFKVYLPRAQDGAGPARQSELLEQARGGSETILLVEDDAEVRDLAQLVLQQQGYTVLTAVDGEDALRLAAEHSGPIHLLLSDVVLPGINAAALADHLKRWRPEVKTLFMSGYTQEMIMRYGMLRGRFTLLEKPFSALDLTRSVRAVLGEPVVAASWLRTADRVKPASHRAGDMGRSRRPRIPEPHVTPATAMRSPTSRSRTGVNLRRAAAELDDHLPDGIRRSS